LIFRNRAWSHPLRSGEWTGGEKKKEGGRKKKRAASLLKDVLPPFNSRGRRGLAKQGGGKGLKKMGKKKRRE